MLTLRYPLRQRSLIVVAALLVLLAGCAGMPLPDESTTTESTTALKAGPDTTSNRTVGPEEPRSQEVVIVINNNAFLGNHAGMFVGSRLSDPAGSYVAARSDRSGWPGPRLTDYVDFQMEDGPRIQLFRFMLSDENFALVKARLPQADRASPLFCAAAVQNAIAGIGPFSKIEPIWFTTPAALAELLHSLTNNQMATGKCAWANGMPC